MKDKILEEYYHILRQMFRKNRIASARVSYRGSGDSGMWGIAEVELEDGTSVWFDNYTSDFAVDDTTDLPRVRCEAEMDVPKEKWDGRGWVVEKTKRLVPLHEIIDAVAARMMDIHAGGWENNDGADGDVYITLEGIRMSHQYYEMISHSAIYEIEAPFSPMEEFTDKLKGV